MAATIQRAREAAQTGGALLATMGGGGDAAALDEADAALPVTVGGDDEQLGRGVDSGAAELAAVR